MSTSQERILTLDAVRGVAVMGILLMNIVAFAMPQQAYFQPRAYGGSTGADLWTWAIAFVLIEGKMRGLFSLLFGASMLLVIQRADASGISGPRVHLVRMAWLFVFGMAHYWLVWVGDILNHYALIGIAATLFVRKTTDHLIRWAIGLFLLSFTVWGITMGGSLVFEHIASNPDAPTEMRQGFVEMRDAYGEPGSQAIAAQLSAYRGSYADAVAIRAQDGVFGPLYLTLFNGVETLALMVLGMALFKNGFLRGDWRENDYRIVMKRSYLVGVPASAALAFILWFNGLDTIQLAAVGFAFGTPLRIAVMLGHAALIVLLVKRFSTHRFVARLAATGKAAFTNYLGTSILMTLLFYGYGFGWFGYLSRWQIYLIPPVIWGLMLLWSKPWLDRYRYGPLEWLWRSLSRGKMQRMT